MSPPALVAPPIDVSIMFFGEPAMLAYRIEGAVNENGRRREAMQDQL
jgi:hypothetical protein